MNDLHMTYAESRDMIQTGDIILFSGNSFVSCLIQTVTSSMWSHCGIVVRMEPYDSLLLLESTTLSNLVDIQSGEHRQGVQLVPLSQRIATYAGKVAWRALIAERSPEQINALATFRMESKLKAYEQDLVELIKSEYDGIFGMNCEDLSSLFCSELVAEAYQRMGILSEELPSNEYTPKDFSNEVKLKFENRAMLGQQVRLTIEGKRRRLFE